MSSVLAINLLIGSQFDLVIVLPLLLVGLAILALKRGRPMRSPEPDFTVPYDWAEQGI